MLATRSRPSPFQDGSTKDNRMKPRQWMVKLLATALDMMGLQRWSVSVQINTGMERVAVADIQPEYEVACIRISSETKGDLTGRRALLHEVIHLQHAPMYTAWEYVLAMVPEEQRPLAHKILDEADEIVVQREATAWEEVICSNTRSHGGFTNCETCGIINMTDVDQESPVITKE